jgi:phage-related protein
VWTVHTVNRAVDSEIEALPADMRARLLRLSAIIEAVGFQGLPHDTVKHLEGKLWELRLRRRDGISRAIYVAASSHRVVIVRVFVKKTPKQELELARTRANEVT